jgi:hypothetical protein
VRLNLFELGWEHGTISPLAVDLLGRRDAVRAQPPRNIIEIAFDTEFEKLHTLTVQYATRIGNDTVVQVYSSPAVVDGKQLISAGNAVVKVGRRLSNQIARP